MKAALSIAAAGLLFTSAARAEEDSPSPATGRWELDARAFFPAGAVNAAFDSRRTPRSSRRSGCG